MEPRASVERGVLVGRWLRKGVGAFAIALCGASASSCSSVLGADGFRRGDCDEGAKQCAGNTKQTCEAGQWKSQSDCESGTCIDGECVGECLTGRKRCADGVPQECVAEQWQGNTACDGERHCQAGECVVSCSVGDVRCHESTPQVCAAGQWQDRAEGACKDSTCMLGDCVGDCPLGAQQCEGNTPQICDPTLKWKNLPACQGTCWEGSCLGPSCPDLEASKTCGVAGAESCCSSPVVTGGTYNRSNEPEFPATVSDFRLDRFEVTVGRFRKFWEAYPASKPKSGAGAHPLIANSGWDPAWDSHLAADKAGLTEELQACNGAFTYSTWTIDKGANEDLPINCLQWYTALAFCAWDHGRLPTEAEWNYAAAGGAEQRKYPWSTPDDPALPDIKHAVFNCEGAGDSASCDLADILAVGSRSPLGDGKWGQADLVGSVEEWVLDWFEPYVSPCSDCAQLATDPDEWTSYRVIRGGGYWFSDGTNMDTFSRDKSGPNGVYEGVGIRCARDL